MICNKCGTQIVEESTFCPKCGEKLATDEAKQQETALTAQSAATATPNPDTQQPSNAPIPAVGADGVRENSNSKSIISVVLVILLIVGAVYFKTTLYHAGKELTDVIADVSDSNNKYVLMVKGGYRENDPNITYEKAFSAFFDMPRWKYFKADNGKDVVEFTGGCTYQDVAVKARIQFVVDEANRTFEATYLAFNEVPQGMLLLAGLVEKTFSEYSKSNSSTETSTQERVPQNSSTDSGVTYFVESDKSIDEEYQPAVTLYKDGRFSFCVNAGEHMGFYNGTYSAKEDTYTFDVTEAEFYGSKNSYKEKFTMRRGNGTLTYESEDSLGLTITGSVFSLSVTPPKAIAYTRMLQEAFNIEDDGDDGDGSGSGSGSGSYVDANGRFEWVTMPEAQRNYVGGGFISGTYVEPVRMGSIIQGAIKNVTGKNFSHVGVTFSLYDSSGNQIGSASDYISNFKGGNTWKFKATFLEDSVSSFEFAEITAW